MRNIAFIFCLVFAFDIAFAQLKLELVQVVTRHGDRTPINKLPNDDSVWACEDDLYGTILQPTNPLYEFGYRPNDEYFLGNCASGTLTARGAQQHLRMGQEFRKKYVTDMKFLPEKFDPELVYVRSTDIPRTKKSAQANMLGLYPTEFRDPRTPMRINLVESSMEFMYPNSALCPRVDALKNARMNTPEYAALTKKYELLHDYLARFFNVSTKQLPSFDKIYDNLNCRLFNNKPLPTGMPLEIANDVIDAGVEFLTYVFKDVPFASLGMSEFLSEILGNIEAAVAGTSSHKYYLYSGHDTTIAPVLGALQAPDALTNFWPPYAAHIVFELYSDATSNYFIQLQYNGIPFMVPSCSNVLCPLKEFIQYLETILPEDLTQVCAV